MNRGLYNLLSLYLYRINIDSIYKSAISWGAYDGQEPTVRKALEQGARARLTWDYTLPEPITLAALRGYANIVKLLLDHGVKPKYSWENDEDGTESWFIMDWEHFELYSILDWPPWTAALACDHAEVLKVLIEQNAFVPRAWDLFNASGEGCFETLKVLVGAIPQWAELAQSEYPTILGLAINASWDNLDIARFLVDSGSPINYIDTNQDTPLAMAANIGNIETVRFLLELQNCCWKRLTSKAKLPVVGMTGFGYFTRRRPVALRSLCGLAWMQDAMQIAGCVWSIVLSAWMLPTDYPTAGII